MLKSLQHVIHRTLITTGLSQHNWLDALNKSGPTAVILLNRRRNRFFSNLLPVRGETGLNERTQGADCLASFSCLTRTLMKEARLEKFKKSCPTS